MSEEFMTSFSIDLGGDVDDIPPEMDVKATYGDITVDDFARQHVIGYLNLPLEWDEVNEGWKLNVTLGNLHLMERLMTDLGAMDFGDALEVGEDDGLEKEPGVLMDFGFRQYKEDAHYADE